MISNDLEKVAQTEKEYQRYLQVIGHQIDDTPSLKYGLYYINIYNVFKFKINNIKKDIEMLEKKLSEFKGENLNLTENKE